jgi:hypothetical protein
MGLSSLSVALSDTVDAAVEWPLIERFYQEQLEGIAAECFPRQRSRHEITTRTRVGRTQDGN